MSVKKGIYLVANKKSEELCLNLIYSIRESGCLLPIRIIPFGGLPIQLPSALEQVEMVDLAVFTNEAIKFIDDLQTMLTDCPRGFLLRFVAWFGDWDEFIYSDNDIVALCKWDVFFEQLKEHDFVHADQEFITKGIFNYNKPEALDTYFENDPLSSIFTAGHFAARRKPEFIGDFYKAIDWFKDHPDVPKKHDQAFMHIASLIGNWNILNLCKPPYNWLSSWAGDYETNLQLIQKLQAQKGEGMISHIHYSGGQPSGLEPIHDFLFSAKSTKHRLKYLIYNGTLKLVGISYLSKRKRNLMNKIKVFLGK